MSEKQSKSLPFTGGTVSVSGHKTLFKEAFFPDGARLVATSLERAGRRGDWKLTILHGQTGTPHTKGVRPRLHSHKGLEMSVQAGGNGSRRICILQRLIPSISGLDEKVTFYRDLASSLNNLQEEQRPEPRPTRVVTSLPNVPSPAIPPAPVEASTATLPALATTRGQAKKSFVPAEDTALLVEALRERGKTAFNYDDVLDVLADLFGMDISNRRSFVYVTKLLLQWNFAKKGDDGVYTLTTSGSPPAHKASTHRATTKGVSTSTSDVISDLEDELAELHGRADPDEAKEIDERIADVDSKIAETTERLERLQGRRQSLLEKRAKCTLTPEENARMLAIAERLEAIRALLR
jgi:hypothetical protein